MRRFRLKGQEIVEEQQPIQAQQLSQDQHISHDKQPSLEQQSSPAHSIKSIVFASPAELEDVPELSGVHEYTLRECALSDHHVRHDCHAKYSYGLLNAIELRDYRLVPNDFSFYLMLDSLVIIEHKEIPLLTAFAKKLGDREFSEKHEELTPQTVFISLLEEIIQNNDRKIEVIEGYLEQLEEKIMQEAKREYVKEIIGARKLIMHLRHQLEPLQFAVQSFMDNENNLFTAQQIKALKILSFKSARMVENTTLLREYATQVREAFEAEKDISSNELMKIFTVVTSVFLPLTLVVGWYGMNFRYIPEFSWRYGYLYVIGLNLAIVGIMVYLFRKNKWI